MIYPIDNSACKNGQDIMTLRLALNIDHIATVRMREAAHTLIQSVLHSWQWKLVQMASQRICAKTGGIFAI